MLIASSHYQNEEKTKVLEPLKIEDFQAKEGLSRLHTM